MVNSRGRITFTVPSVAEVLQAHTKGTRGRTSSQLQPWMRRRVPAPAVACASTVLKVILPEMIPRNVGWSGRAQSTARCAETQDPLIGN